MWFKQEQWRTGWSQDIHASVVIDKGAWIGRNVVIYPNVVIDENVAIGDNVTIFAGAYIGKPPKVTGIVPPKEYRLSTHIQKGCVIGASSTIYAGVDLGENVLIGDGVRVRENTSIGDETVIGSNSTLQNDVVIGRGVRVVDLSHITAGVTIEDNVFWSVGVLSMNDNRDGTGLARMTIGHHAFIGGGALLLPGHDIGEHSIVGAGSVVTHAVEPGSRVQGVPARRIHDVSYDGQVLSPIEE